MLAKLPRIFLTKQRGAMFGMDARVALAIFTTLAAVGGYTMLSRIGTAHAARLIRELQALEGAFEALQTDLGQPIVHGSAIGSNVNALFSALRQQPGGSVGERWNGPYLNDTFPTSHQRYGVWNSYTTRGTGTTPTACVATEACYLWLTLTEVPENVFIEVNRVIDENGGDLIETQPRTQGRVTYTGTTMSYRAIGWDSRRGRTIK